MEKLILWLKANLHPSHQWLRKSYLLKGQLNGKSSLKRQRVLSMDWGLHIDEGIKAAVTGLQLSDFPTLMSCEGHQEREGSIPLVVVGEHSRILDIRSEGQEELFNDQLKTVSVPLALRITRFLTMRTGPFTRKKLLALDSPGFRENYPELWKQANHLCEQSGMTAQLNARNALSRTGLSPSEKTGLLPGALQRQKQEGELFDKAITLVEKYNNLKGSKDLSARINVAGIRGGIFDIRAGTPESRTGAAQSDPDILLKQQAEMKAFSIYLKENFPCQE